jgi:hypothetical protein
MEKCMVAFFFSHSSLAFCEAVLTHRLQARTHMVHGKVCAGNHSSEGAHGILKKVACNCVKGRMEKMSAGSHKSHGKRDCSTHKP